MTDHRTHPSQDRQDWPLWASSVVQTLERVGHDLQTLHDRDFGQDIKAMQKDLHELNIVVAVLKERLAIRSAVWGALGAGIIIVIELAIRRVT